MNHHDLKTWPQYFSQVAAGLKLFECRKNDRDFKEGDTISLHEFDPVADFYTGKSLSFKIGYVLDLKTYLKLDSEYVVFSLLEVK